jgi:light-regulated signal transduction histidine kinase (bacteriophytochrome)
MVTLQNCDSEPIHIPGAIQPTGALVVVDVTGRLAFISGNAQALLGMTLALGEALVLDPLPVNGRMRLQGWIDNPHSDFEPFVLERGKFSFDVIGYLNDDGLLVMEFELRREPIDVVTPALSRAYQSIEKLKRQRSIESLLTVAVAVAVAEIRALTGFDRVMAYRFHPDDSGEVVREARREDLEGWEGRRYPASDIPAQARRLYVKNTLRLIGDARYMPVPIHAACSYATTALDLSAAVLRSVSPIHLDYMANMGVRASMSISVVIHGRLWGMIACHHVEPRHVAFGIRMACEVIAQILSATIASFEAQARAFKLKESLAMVNRIVLRVWNNDNLLAALTQEAPTPAALILHDACFCSWGGGITVCDGLAPRGNVRELVGVLAATKRRVVSSASIARDFPDLQTLVPYAGLLACCFDAQNEGWIIWLRREQIETVVWGGRPEKCYQVGPHGPRLTPRGSFAEWREVVRDTANPWLQEELQAAESLRDELAQICNSRAAEMDRARTALLAMLGHDLRDPLQSISVAAQLISRSDGGQDAKMGERIRTSSDRMQRLISQVLDLSRLQGGLGLGMQVARCDIAPLITDLIEEARLAQPAVRFEAEIEAPLQLVADSDRIAQVIAHLLSNAAKHGRLGAPIRVSAQKYHDEIVLSVVNAGDPIDPAQMEHLFEPFKPQSLHQVCNRNGLGLGLYIADQVVNGHGGRIEVRCEGGEVKFVVTLPAPTLDN